ncbi:uncharacterized protein LOC110452833 [Mizuhopecten yessoensis]|uniref:GRB2-associated and regulator of MAPK protein n=1 Tax=Mizuhopecten yessoensis TaxID=6573 RepID=A0A210QIR0_MIZYE|nr:uncharacterized protein LOC110452833 [Mizuhopecten yessoensis]OWF48622.1 hypothetical protein KP79_PYT01146 [Mizuhopecten yessoensis]
MATTNDDLTWGDDVLTLEEVISSRTFPIIVRVEGGSYGKQESESISRGDIFKLDSVDGNQIIGYCYKGVLHKCEIESEDDNIPCKQILFNNDTAKNIDVIVCLTKCDEVNMPFASNSVPPKPSPSRAYVDFSLPVPANRTSLEAKSTPPPVPLRGKPKTKPADEERKPMPPPRKPSTSSLSEHSITDMQGPKPPGRTEKNEISSTLEEECPYDAYEIADEETENIYDEAEDIELPTAASPDYSLKHKAIEFFSNFKMKNRMQKLKSKLANAMKKEKTVTEDDDNDEEDDEDYVYPEWKPTKKLNEKQNHKETANRYDMLEKRLALEKPPNNAYTPLSVGGVGKADTSFASLSITGLADRLAICGLNNVAEKCRKEKVDGRLFLTLTDNDLREVFSVNELQIKKIRMAQNHNWTPKV